MIITEDEAGHLKTWVVRKLEDISDADSDVLADYVLALIRAETPEPELRLNAIENLEDFLKEYTPAFVDEIFQALHSKSFIPGYKPPQTSPPNDSVLATSSAPKLPFVSLAPGLVDVGTIQQSRKRPHHDQYQSANGNDPHFTRVDRQMKHPRRGGPRGGRHDSFAGRYPNGLSGTPLGSQARGQVSFPEMPLPSPDPNDPMMAMMLQAIGLPLTQGTALPNANPPGGYLQPAGQPYFHDGPGKNKINARCRDYDTMGYCARGDTCPFEHGNDHLVVPGQDEYDPKNSVMTDVQATPPQANGSRFQGMSVRGGESIQGSGRGRGSRGGFGPIKRNNRADFSQAGPNFDQSNTTIVVEQIPEEKFDQQSVRDFFSAFGSIEDIDMRPYKHLAIVKFGDYWAARRAYESPKVIFDNRFVKVYWYKPENLPTSRDGLDNVQPSTPVKEDAPAFDKEEFERNATAAQRKLEEKKSLMKETEAKRKVLEQQTEELVRKQAEEKRKLMEKLASKGAPESKSPKSIANGSLSQTNGTDHKSDGASAQTKALRAQVAALEAEARSLGLDTALTESPWPSRGRGRGGGRGRGSYRGWEGFAGREGSFDSARGSSRGRGSFFSGRGYNLDNRTKKVSVSGVDMSNTKDEALRQHLLAIGEFEAIEPSTEKADMQVITFKDRRTAEKFMYGSKNIPSVGQVELAWVNTPPAPLHPATKTNTGEDSMMANSNTNGDHHANTADAADVDYDVAEEDDRW